MNGQCLDFTKLENGNLKLTLTDMGREELPDLIDKYGQDDARIMSELMEHQLCNGWENVPPEQIGALTGCDLILTDDIERSEDGEDIVALGRVYWHANYMVENPIELLQGNGLVLTGVDD